MLFNCGAALVINELLLWYKVLGEHFYFQVPVWQTVNKKHSALIEFRDVWRVSGELESSRTQVCKSKKTRTLFKRLDGALFFMCCFFMRKLPLEGGNHNGNGGRSHAKSCKVKRDHANLSRQHSTHTQRSPLLRARASNISIIHYLSPFLPLGRLTLHCRILLLSYLV